MGTPDLEEALEALVLAGPWRGTMTELAGALGLEMSGRALSAKLERSLKQNRVTVRRRRAGGKRWIEVAHKDYPSNVVELRPNGRTRPPRAPGGADQQAPPPVDPLERYRVHPKGPPIPDEWGDALEMPSTPLCTAAAHLAYASVLLYAEVGSGPEREACQKALMATLDLFDNDDKAAAMKLPRSLWERAYSS